MTEEEDILHPFYDYPDSDLLKLEVKQTRLPFIGLGLFAKQGFQAGEIIGEYYGSILSCLNSQNDAFNDQDKLLEIDPEICVIGRGPASRINDVIKLDKHLFGTEEYKKYKEENEFPSHQGFKRNAKISGGSKQKIFIKTLREIQPGQEIYIDYGFKYWDYFHQYAFLAQQQLNQ